MPRCSPADLPHLIALAADAEAQSSKRHGLGVTFPFDAHPEGVARLWAVGDCRRDGKSNRAGFEVVPAKERSNRRLAELRLAGNGCLRCRWFFYTDHPGWPETLSRLQERKLRLDESEASAKTDDPFALMAAHAVSAARVSWCLCCGCTLTDPLSIRFDIGPQCGSMVHARFLRSWREARTGQSEDRPHRATAAREAVMADWRAKVREIHPDTGGDTEGPGDRMAARQADRNAKLRQVNLFAGAAP